VTPLHDLDLSTHSRNPYALQAAGVQPASCATPILAIYLSVILSPQSAESGVCISAEEAKLLHRTVLDDLKLPKRTAEQVVQLLNASRSCPTVLLFGVQPESQDLPADTCSTLRLSQLISHGTTRLEVCRWLHAVGPAHWWIACHLAEISRCALTADTNTEVSCLRGAPSCPSRGSMMNAALVGANLEQCAKMRSLLTGHQVASILEVPPGQLIGEVLNQVIGMQMQNPDWGEEDLVCWLREKSSNIKGK